MDIDVTRYARPARKKPTCQQCGGIMRKTTHTERTGSALASLIIFVAAFFLLFLFPVGTILGALLMLYAIVRKTRHTMRIWRCQQCGNYFERK